MKINYFATILVLSLLTMIAPFSIDSYLPSFPELIKVYNVEVSALQFSIAIYTFFSAISMFIVGHFSDVLGRKKIILFGLFGYSLTSLLIIFVGNFQLFLIYRALQGFLGAMASILSRSIIRDLYSGTKAHKAMSLLSIFFSISPIIAPVIGGYLQSFFGWKAIFVFMSVYGCLLFIVFFICIPESLPVDNRIKLNLATTIQTYTKMFKNTEFIIKNLILSFVFCHIGIFIGSVPYFAEILNFDTTQYYLIFLPAISGTILGSFFSGKLAGKIKAKSFLKISVVINLIVIIVMLAYQLLNIKNSHYLSMMLPWTFLYFATSFSAPILSLNILNLVDKSNIGITASFQGLFQVMGFSIVLATISPLINGNLTLIYAIPFSIQTLSVIGWIIIDGNSLKKRLNEKKKLNK